MGVSTKKLRFNWCNFVEVMLSLMIVMILLVYTFGNDSNEVYDNLEPQPVPNMDDFDIDDI